MHKYNYYLFDLDRTLWDFDKNAKSAIFKLLDKYSLSALLGIHNKEEFFKRYEEINHRLWSNYEAGKITKEYLRSARFYETFITYSNESTACENHKLQEFSIEFGEAYLNQMTYETALEPHAREVLCALKNDGAKIAVVTNGFQEVQYRKLNNSNLMGFIDAVIISEEVGVHKPNPQIFQKALEAICPPDEYATNRTQIKQGSLMVGDDFANDIEGAQIFGIDQFYYNPHHKPCDGGPTYESDTLLDLFSRNSNTHSPKPASCEDL
jgi:putative hydrolase of the HAD superfamily